MTTTTEITGTAADEVIAALSAECDERRRMLDDLFLQAQDSREALLRLVRAIRSAGLASLTELADRYEAVARQQHEQAVQLLERHQAMGV